MATVARSARLMLDKTWTEELNEFANNALFTKDLCNGKRQISRCCAFRKAASQAEADNFRGNEVKRLSEHTSFCFDTANSPAYNAKTIDHRCMGVGTDKGIRINIRFRRLLFW